jgi:glyoxylase-like metal-dependent hydrolase (beta-lactamase superfamily II)
VDVFYDGSTITFGDYTVTVHHTPGHCPGGVCLQMGRTGTTGMELFVGDTLFASSVRSNRSARR